MRSATSIALLTSPTAGPRRHHASSRRQTVVRDRRHYRGGRPGGDRWPAPTSLRMMPRRTPIRLCGPLTTVPAFLAVSRAVLRPRVPIAQRTLRRPPIRRDLIRPTVSVELDRRHTRLSALFDSASRLVLRRRSWLHPSRSTMHSKGIDGTCRILLLDVTSGHKRFAASGFSACRRGGWRQLAPEVGLEGDLIEGPPRLLRSLLSIDTMIGQPRRDWKTHNIAGIRPRDTATAYLGSWSTRVFRHG